MTDRTVKVNLVAQVAGFINGTRQAAAATKELGKSTVEAKAQIEKQGQAMTRVGTAFLAGGAVAAAGLALIIKASTEYGAKMAQLQSLSHASADDMRRLSDAAMSQGQAFGFSATQVADAEIELTKAGRSTADIMGGDLKGALALAAAGQMDVAQATSIAVAAVTEFHDTGATIPHVADDLAAGADKALGSVADLGMALNQSGLVAAQFGLNIDETVGTLSAFAQGGLIGSDAGTSFKTMLTQLASPTKQAQAALDKYNITINDSKGNFVGITNLAGQLATKLSSKNGVDGAARRAALSTIFGNDAIRASQILYTQGAKGMQDWINSVNDTGFASAQAAGKMNSLQGDVQKLSAIFQTDLIKAGDSAQNSLRGVVQSATGLLKAFGDLPAPIQGAIVPLGLAVAGIGLIGGAALIAVPKIVAFKAAMVEANISGKTLAGTFGKGGAVLVGLMAVAGALAAIGQHGTASSQQVEQAGVAINRGWKGIDKTFDHVHNGIQDVHGLKAALDTLGDGASEASMAKVVDGLTAIGGLNPFPTHLADTYKSNEQALDAMGQQLAGLASRSYPQAARSFASLVRQYKLGTTQTKTLLDNMPAYKEALIAQLGKVHIAATQQNILNAAMGRGRVGAKLAAQAQKEAAAAAAKNAAQLAKLTGSGDDATQSMKDLYDALNNLGSTELDARSAARKFQQAIDDATKAVHDNGKGLDINTQKGRDNQAALDDIAQSAAASAAAYVKNGGSAAGAAKLIASGRSAYIRAAEAMGLSKAEANRLADALHLIPKSVSTAAKAVGFTEAERQADILSGKMNNLDGTHATIYIDVAGSAAGASGRAGQIARNAGFAAGGAVGGRGPKGVDSVPAMLAPGEHVWTDREVDAVGGQGAMYRMRAAARTGRLQRYAGGGEVRAYSGAGSSYGATATAFPSHVTLLDENGGVITTARVVADRQISKYDLDRRRRMPRA